MKKAISVWRFEDAPKKLKDLSPNGGDEDWLVLVKKEQVKWFEECGTPYWVEKMDTCYNPSRVELKNGDVIYIGGHA